MTNGPNPESDARKRAIVLLLSQKFGILTHKHSSHPDWYFLAGKKSEVFITDSMAQHHERPWFDLAKSDIEELAANPAAFIIFILGEADSFLVIPANQLKDEIENSRKGKSQLKGDRYYFNLKFKPHFEQIPNLNLRPFKGNLELIQKAISQ